MLKEIRSDILLRKKVEFHKGLNVVLGDDDGTNSIGKSNLLMIIDFVFGGETYITHNRDVVENIGHHEYQFMFDFSGEQLYFCRCILQEKSTEECKRKYTSLPAFK